MSNMSAKNENNKDFHLICFYSIYHPPPKKKKKKKKERKEKTAVYNVLCTNHQAILP